jgi:DNA repair exonuclease SbcCD ATPase subunit
VIRRLTLRNWRNYEDLDLRLRPGTTFIVAPNGIGKTSIIEAASWAVFGSSRPSLRPGNAVRAGASSAVASIELVLPDERVLTITRVLPKKAGATAPDPAVYLDDEQVTGHEAQELAHRLYGADMRFIARLSMPRWPLEAGKLPELQLHDHLCRLFGVDRLLTAAAELDHRVKAQEKLIREARQGTPAPATVLSGLRDRLEAREAAFAAAEAAHRRASDRIGSAREAQGARALLAQWRVRSESFGGKMHELALEAAPYVAAASPDTVRADTVRADTVRADTVRADTVQADLDAALMAATSELEELRVRRATLAGKAAALEQHAAALEGAHGDCPVCRRPLDEEAASVARAAHHDELARLRELAASLDGEEASAAGRRDRIRALICAVRAVPHPGPRPAIDERAESDDGPSLEDLNAESQRLLQEMVRRKSELDLAERELREAQQGTAAHARLEELYAADAVLRASHTAISATTRELLDRTIEPLTAEVNARWQQLFPQRGTLRTQSTGDVSREVNGESLPYSAFSTGERMGLVILLRLLVLEMATRVDFCWFDEPLEHLDPEARRRVAQALARAAAAGPLRQIVVTTYEEPLARRLAERHPGHVNLIYVRHGQQR